MTDRSKGQDKQMGTAPQTEGFRAQRRQLLRMGAAGMPMVLTLRATASEAVISQLQCMFTLPGSMKILVDDQGQAWVGTRSIDTGSKGFKVSSLNKFKDKANYVFPSGSVPSGYRPSSCSSNSCDSGGSGHGHDEAFYQQVPGSDEHGYYASDNLGRSNRGGGRGGRGGGGHSHDNCDDHSGSSTWTDCGYNLYTYGNNHTVTPGNYVTSQGNWNLSGGDGLFLSLSLIYADEYGNAGSWPGISCIVSILNYLGQ